MVAKAILALCGSVLLVQAASAQCLGYNSGVGLANNLAFADIAAAEMAGARIGAELAGARLAGPGCGMGAPAPILQAPFSTSGGVFTVTSSSPISPAGITIYSENTIEGPMEVAGNLPLLATVNVEGQFPSNGAAGTSYGCGNGQIGITNESLAAAGLGGASSGTLARAELAGAAAAAAGLAGAQLAGAEIAAASRLARPCGTVY